MATKLSRKTIKALKNTVIKLDEAIEALNEMSSGGQYLAVMKLGDTPQKSFYAMSEIKNVKKVFEIVIKKAEIKPRYTAKQIIEREA